MTDLNKEAEEYAKNKSSANVFQKAHIKDFIAGANSKYVKQQILLAKIDALRNIAGDDDEHTEKRRVLHITRFQQELKQLQDE
jgi:hypothetical protein